MRLTFPLSLALTCFAAAGAQHADKVDPAFMKHARIETMHPAPRDVKGGKAHSRFGIFDVDSIPNFNGQFFTFGYDPSGNPKRHWYTNTVGNPPQMGRTTTIGAPIQPVNVELDDENGNLRYDNGTPLISNATPYVSNVLASPVFSNFKYSSGSQPTQFSDAVQRAEFYHNMKSNWHTLLAPTVLPAVTMRIRQTANCDSGPSGAGCNYVYALNGDGTCCAFILVNDSSPDFVFETGLSQIIANDIGANSIKTKDISSFLFKDVFLYFGDTSQCCVLGFHSYFFGSGSKVEPRWVFDFASWISPDLIGPTFSDVTGLSHEIAEIYDDPFVASDGVHNLTPWWLAPNGGCGNVLETGDAIEGLPNATYPIVGRDGFTYHPQNEALLQWFEFKDPSDALDGAYSYPNENVLQGLSALEQPGCP